MQHPTRTAAAAVADTIRLAADRHRVPRAVALAFSWAESRHQPTLEGDLGWHELDGGARYRRLVLDAPKFATNPARLTPELWHSYGLFQLLAPYHAEPAEDPRVLLDAAINADRGCRTIARQLARAGGDVDRARLAYVGAGIDGQRIGAAHRLLVLSRLRAALARWKDG